MKYFLLLEVKLSLTKFRFKKKVNLISNYLLIILFKYKFLKKILRKVLSKFVTLFHLLSYDVSSTEDNKK